METENALAEEAEIITDEDQAEVVTDEDQAEESPDEDQEDGDKTPEWLKRRIAKAAKNQGAAERERDTALRKAQELAEEKTRLAEENARILKDLEAAKAERLKSTGRPKLEDFETDEDFYDALTDWKLEKRDAETKQEREQAQQTQTREQAEAAYRDRVIKTNTNGVAKYEDYENVVFSLPGDVMNPELAQAIFETDVPEDIAYHLGKNPKEAAKISQMPPLKKAVALGKIEARLTNKKTTNAPPPITPVKGKSSSTFDPDKLLAENPKEWIRLRNEGKI